MRCATARSVATWPCRCRRSRPPTQALPAACEPRCGALPRGALRRGVAVLLRLHRPVQPLLPAVAEPPGLFDAGHRRLRGAAELDAHRRALRLGLAGRPRQRPRDAAARGGDGQPGCGRGAVGAARCRRAGAGAGGGGAVPGQRRDHADCRDAAAQAPARRRRTRRAPLRPRAHVGLDRLPRRGADLRRGAAAHRHRGLAAVLRGVSSACSRPPPGACRRRPRRRPASACAHRCGRCCADRRCAGSSAP